MNEITMFEAIGIGPQAVTANVVKKALATAAGEPITVRIDSEGGSVFEGFSIYSAFKAYDGPKHCVIESAAFSIASYIAMAFDRVSITPNGYLMIHNPASETEGDASALGKQAELLTKLQDSMIDAYAAKTNMPRETIEKMMAEETYLNAEEALAAGFVDEIVSEEKPSRVVEASSNRDTMPFRVVASLKPHVIRAADGPAKKGEEGDDTGGSVRDEIRRLQDSGFTLEEIGSRVNRDASTLSSILTEEIMNPPEQLLQDLRNIPSKKKESAMASIKEIKARHPKASDSFIVKAMEEEMTMEEVTLARLAALESENEQLQAKLSAMEEEEHAKAKAQEEEEETAKAQDEEEEKTAKAAAKAKPGAKAVARVRSDPPPKESAKVRWQVAMDKCIASGMSRQKAACAVNSRYPGLREELVEEANN